jgi:ribonucleoside-diphosphate reductase alpha chain
MTPANFQIVEPGSISEWVWNEKYRFHKTDQTIDDTFLRVATAIAQPERDDERFKWRTTFYDAMRNFEFLPGGRILAGAGTGRDVTLFNCYVMGTIEDSLAGIMRACTEAALTLKHGGGVGMDFSTLRPRGAVVKGVDSVSSGAVSFMGLWNEMCATIMSAGARRGAMMAVLRCDHPDIEEFIKAKHTPGNLTNFNLSVAVTDSFVEAVKQDADWPLRFDGVTYTVVRARDLWNKILRSTYEYSEPGVIFIDFVNHTNPLAGSEVIAASNPCGEQMLPPHGACLLGHLNLAQLVREPFTNQAVFDFHRLEQLVPVAVRFLDNVIDVSKHPLPEQKDEARLKRRIGLGVTGLADALFMLGMRYGSPEAVEITKRIMKRIRDHALQASSVLANIKGEYPLWTKAHGPIRRNSHLMSIAPCGTTSLFAGNVSSGIEPVFAMRQWRTVLMPDGTKQKMLTIDYARRMLDTLKFSQDDNNEVVADDLKPADHLVMMAACQPYVDGAISKTINCPESLSFDDFKKIYLTAYESRLKGCTTYRPSEIRGSVLESADKPAPVVTSTSGNVVQLGKPLDRPVAVDGSTYKIKPAGSEHALYVTINDIVQDGRRRPFEIFFNSKKVDEFAWMVALSRMISAVFRKGGDVAFVADELKAVFEPRGGHWNDGKYVPSICAAIGDVIHTHMVSIGFVEVAGESGEVVAAPVVPLVVRGVHCPKCQSGMLRRAEGCSSCDNCDYTKC